MMLRDLIDELRNRSYSNDHLLAGWRRFLQRRRAAALDSISRRPPKTRRLANLPWINDEGKVESYSFIDAMRDMWDLDAMRDIWDQQAHMIMWMTDPEAYALHVEEQQAKAAWEAALDWIEQKHQPQAESPVVFDWNWPNPDVSQSPKPLGVGDLEDEWEDDDRDD